MIEKIELQELLDHGSFHRIDPFGDGRQIIVRAREEDVSSQRGVLLAERQATVDGQSVLVQRYRVLLSPPPMRPGQASMSADLAARFAPEHELVAVSDATVYVPRHPDGFSDTEVEQILAVIRWG